jgi:succinoglycan biosynthesis transport protein ExoP
MTYIPDDGWRRRGREPVVPNRGLPLTSANRNADFTAIDAFEVDSHFGLGPADNRLLTYWRIVYTRRWLVLSIFIAAILIGVAVTLLATPLYSASATLEINREAPKIVNVQDAQPTEVDTTDDEFFETQYALLKSRSLAERVANALNLADNQAFLTQFNGGGGSALMSLIAPGAGARSNASRAVRQSSAVALVQEHLTITPVRGSRVVAVSYESPSPTIAAWIANAAAENFITATIDRRFQANAYAKTFLEQRLAEVKQKLEDSEKGLVDYAESERIINVAGPPAQDATGGTGPGRSIETSDLVALDAELDAAKGERIAAQERWSHARSAAGLNDPEVLGNATITTLQNARAELAAKYAQDLGKFTPDYPTMIQTKAQIAELDKEISTQSETIKGSLKTAYDTALGREAALLAQVNGLKGTLLDQDKRSIQYNILQRDVDTNRTLYDGLLQRYKEIGVAGGIGTNNISVVDKANPPGSPFSPKPLHNIALAAAIGLALGLLAAFGLELMDESVRSPDDVETKMALPMLGSIPLLSTLAPLDALKDRRSIVSEAYYSARTALQFSTSDGTPRSLVVTSSRPGEGKTTTAMALALNFARLGLRVLLIDSDLRHPSLHRLLDRPIDRGLTLFLTNSVGLDDIIQTTDYKNLFLTTSGPVPPNPAELLAGPRFAALLAEAESKFDLVVMDSAPVMGLADAPLIASVAAGTVFVIEAGWTRTALAKIALGRLRAANARIIGCLLTKFNAKKAGYGYGYGDSYGYGDEAYAYGYAAADPQTLEPLEPPAVDAA